MRKFIELPPAGDGTAVDENIHLDSSLVAEAVPLSAAACAVGLHDGRIFAVALSASEVVRRVLEADEEVQAFELYKRTRTVILDWFDFRIKHLRERRDKHEDKSADLRLTEVEGMQNFVKGKLGL